MLKRRAFIPAGQTLGTCLHAKAGSIAKGLKLNLVKTSLFDLYKIGIGPSSSHTMGPMRAARAFLLALDAHHLLSPTAEVHVDLYGSRGLTGRGHCTDRAVIRGRLGEEASTNDPGTIDSKLESIR